LANPDVNRPSGGLLSAGLPPATGDTTHQEDQMSVQGRPAPTSGMRLEVVVIPVSDVDRALSFYRGLGWRVDADVAPEPDFRVVQVTPPDSECSVIFGTRVTEAAPGSTRGLHLAVYDIEAARADLLARDVEVSEVFHDAGGIFHHAGTASRVSGRAPSGASYGSFASFRDPDGNEWVLQEIQVRLPGR
jgi:catechol 2,3-dioxygenase-like lactoylglutathione lyase family enzyme